MSAPIVDPGRSFDATTNAVPKTRLVEEQAQMSPYMGPVSRPTLAHWPRYPIQRSPKAYDVLLREVG